MSTQFRENLKQEHPLQIAGAINAYAAILAKKAGFKALYLSGAGVANFSYGIPDIGGTHLDHVLIDAERILAAADLPLLVDIDTGWDIPKTIKAMIGAGVAAVQIEDQPVNKRCGHIAGKSVVPQLEMVARIKAAVDARTDPSFIIMARTDAYALEGLEKSIERAKAYIEAGADMIFPEALATLEEFRRFKEAVGVPILANLTEFGKTPLFTTDDLHQAGVDMALYPLSAARSMNLAALRVYQEIRSKGTQKGILNTMQTRDALYEFLDYRVEDPI